MCQKWNDAKPALLSRCIKDGICVLSLGATSTIQSVLMERCVRERFNWVWNESDVPNPPDMCMDFTRVLWTYRSCPISKHSGCVSPLISTQAGQCHEWLQHATCISTPQVAFADTISLTLHFSIPHTCTYVHAL